MLIKVGGNWFHPSRIALKNDPDIRTEFGREFARYERTKIIGNGWTLHIAGTPDEVAAEINRQIKQGE